MRIDLQTIIIIRLTCNYDVLTDYTSFYPVASAVSRVNRRNESDSLYDRRSHLTPVLLTFGRVVTHSAPSYKSRVLKITFLHLQIAC